MSTISSAMECLERQCLIVLILLDRWEFSTTCSISKVRRTTLGGCLWGSCLWYLKHVMFCFCLRLLLTMLHFIFEYFPQYLFWIIVLWVLEKYWCYNSDQKGSFVLLRPFHITKLPPAAYTVSIGPGTTIIDRFVCDGFGGDGLRRLSIRHPPLGDEWLLLLYLIKLVVFSQSSETLQ